MFVGEVEEEDVVSLAVDGFLDGVGLVSDEGGEYAEVAHASYDVVPVGFAQVQVGFFGEEEDGFEFPVGEGINQFAQDIFDYDLAVDVGGVFEVNDYGAACSLLDLKMLSSSRVASPGQSVKKPELASEWKREANASRTCWLQFKSRIASPKFCMLSLPCSLSIFQSRLNSRAEVPGRCRAFTSMPITVFRGNCSSATLKFCEGVKVWILS